MRTGKSQKSTKGDGHNPHLRINVARALVAEVFEEVRGRSPGDPLRAFQQKLSEMPLWPPAPGPGRAQELVRQEAPAGPASEDELFNLLN